MKCGRGRKSHIRLTDLTVLHAGGGAYTHGNALTDPWPRPRSHFPIPHGQGQAPVVPGVRGQVSQPA